jgi:hypothetical protein
MNTKICQLLIVSILLFASGCGGSYVATNSTAFYLEPFNSNGSIVVISSEHTVNSSLEFSVYKRKFEFKLQANGFTIESDPDKADYIAIVAYGIDDGQTSVVSTPIFGQTGGGTTYSQGTIINNSGATTYSGTSYTMPTYGIIGSTSGTSTTYNRAIAINIVEAKSYKRGTPKTVFEGRSKSAGSCSVIVEVFDEMLDALFDEFPGPNGRNRYVRVRADTNC